MAPKQNEAPVVAVLNLKGGVGKTTISAHVMRVLYHITKTAILLIDLDPQFNLTQTVFKRSEYEAIRSTDKTILSVMESPAAPSLLKINTQNQEPPNPSELCNKLRNFTNTPEIHLAIIPGDFRLVKYSLMDDSEQLKFVRNRFLKFVEKARKEYGLVCIDCNPSSSFLTLCALQACTHIVVPVRPDRYSILGLELLDEFVESIPTISPKPKFVVVLNDIPRQNYNSSIEDELRAHAKFGTKTLTARVHKSSKLLANPDYTGFATDKPGPYKNILLKELTAVATELAPNLGLKP